MSNNKQSSIDWIIEKITDMVHESNHPELANLYEKAKAMHEEEIKNAVGVGSQFDRDYLYGYHDKAEQYYKETFGDNK